MRIGLACYRCENRNTAFNLGQIERALREARGRADMLCFGEAFVQGFDALCWDYETDRETALSQDSPAFHRMKQWTAQYGVALLTGYIERAGEALYSSCAVLAEGEILFNYRRVSKGWKEFRHTDAHYREGEEIASFRFMGRDITIALCGDLWDYPERFRTDGLLIWPVYVDYSPREWALGELEAYARTAALAARDVLMVNPIDREPECHGGAYHVCDGAVKRRLPLDQEEILYVDID